MVSGIDTQALGNRSRLSPPGSLVVLWKGQTEATPSLLSTSLPLSYTLQRKRWVHTRSGWPWTLALLPSFQAKIGGLHLCNGLCLYQTSIILVGGFLLQSHTDEKAPEQSEKQGHLCFQSKILAPKPAGAKELSSRVGWVGGDTDGN